MRRSVFSRCMVLQRFSLLPQLPNHPLFKKEPHYPNPSPPPSSMSAVSSSGGRRSAASQCASGDEDADQQRFMTSRRRSRKQKEAERDGFLTATIGNLMGLEGF